MIEHSRSQLTESPSGDCPRCGSSAHIQSFATVWQNGTSRSFHPHTGWIVHQTDRAALTAPPVAPGFDWNRLTYPALLLFCIGSFSLAFFVIIRETAWLWRLLPSLLIVLSAVIVGIMLALLVTAPVRRRSRERAWNAYRHRFAEWQNSWVCAKCGETWVNQLVER